MIVVYILLGIVGLFVLLQVGLRLSIHLKKGKDAPELEGHYGRAVEDSGPALFYFYSEDCGACKPMTPVIEKLTGEFRNVFKIDVSNDLETAREFGVMGTPSTVIVQNGTIQQFWVGPKSEKQLRQYLQSPEVVETA